MAKINLMTFASLREKLGFTKREMDFADTDAIRSWLEAELPGISALPYSIAVDQELTQENTPLADGAEVALMPPFAGG